jgi:subtilase family serine protease
VPANLAAGSYYLMAVADPDNNVIELDDPDNLNGNNLIITPLSVTSP